MKLSSSFVIQLLEVYDEKVDSVEAKLLQRILLVFYIHPGSGQQLSDAKGIPIKP